MAAGSSHQPAKPASGRARPAQAAGTDPVSATAVVKRVARRHGRRPRRGGTAHYRRTARKRVPAKSAAEFLPLYRAAERVYGVNWRLIASIHRQETAFSTAPSTYQGLNDFGCCAGPMQFNVTNGPVSTWQRDGFCPNCGLDDGLVAKFDDAYGEPIRRQLIAAEGRRKKRKRHKAARDRKGDRRDRHGRRKRGKRPARRPAAKNDRPSKPPPRPRRRRTGPTEPSPPPTQPSTTPPTTAPPPPAAECFPIHKLLGCQP